MVERGESDYRRLLNLNLLPCYSLDQGCPCPLLTLNPFGRELLLSDVLAGIKRSTWIERPLDHEHVELKALFLR
jgi:hypothetical protein